MLIRCYLPCFLHKARHRRYCTRVRIVPVQRATVHMCIILTNALWELDLNSRGVKPSVFYIRAPKCHCTDRFTLKTLDILTGINANKSSWTGFQFFYKPDWLSDFFKGEFYFILNNYRRYLRVLGMPYILQMDRYRSWDASIWLLLWLIAYA